MPNLRHRVSGWSPGSQVNVPTPGAITRLREQLESVSAEQGGSYRGWDAPVVY